MQKNTQVRKAGVILLNTGAFFKTYNVEKKRKRDFESCRIPDAFMVLLVEDVYNNFREIDSESALRSRSMWRMSPSTLILEEFEKALLENERKG